MGELEVGGHGVAELGSRKARTLLAALALARGHPVSSDELIDVLWPADPPSRPADQLGVLVSRLRRVVGSDVLPRAGRGYALRVSWLDVDEAHARLADAESRLAAGSLGAARAAADAVLELAARELLPGEDGEWLTVERQALERATARARAIVAEAALLAGDAPAAAAASAGALDADPYDERALQLLMRAHAAAGRPASALAAYAAARRRLSDDLGVSPTADTEAIHLAILLGEPGGGSAAEPGRPTLVGRDTERALLRQLLDGAIAGRASFVVLEGEAGIGKSALLDELLRSARNRVATIEGRCDAMGRDLPLQPVLDGIDLLLAGLSAADVDAVLAGDRPVVGRLLSRIDVVGEADRLVPPGDAAAARAILHAALSRVVHRLADRFGGVLVALDDVHLAGPSTLDWLRDIAGHDGRLLIVVTRRPGASTVPPGGRIVRLGPLGIEDVETLCGLGRGAELHARSGGNPLLLRALATTTNDTDVPFDVRAFAAGQLDGLGPAAPTVLAAAVLGPGLDVDLVADAAGVPARQVLDDLDAGLAAGLLVERNGDLAFAHELVREALADTVSASRRAFLHREAGRALARRPRRDALAVVWHARAGGDLTLAASELVVAARAAAERHDLAHAEQLVDEALELEPSAAAALARTELLVARGAFAQADTEAARAIALGAGAAGYEASGWVAYYLRQRDRALHVAMDGARLDGDAVSRAGCLALAGRIFHSQGQLHDAERQLLASLALAPPGHQGMARVWLGGLRVHQGRPDEALALVDGALADPTAIRHPFAVGHGHFARWYALAQLGRPAEMLDAVARFEAAFEAGDPASDRFRPVTCNLRSWVARTLGNLAEAEELSAEAVELGVFPNHAEPRVHALLDRAEVALLVGDVGGAGRWVDRAASEPDEIGTMLWTRAERIGLLRARCALAAGDHSESAREADVVARGAAERGSRRHEVTARLMLALAEPRRASRPAVARTAALLDDMDRCAASESWRWTALAAAAFGIEQWWCDAERRAARLASAAADQGPRFLQWAGGEIAGLRGG